ncbi:unnamed protein product, partial [Symbiodinium sp. CCMP2456]
GLEFRRLIRDEMMQRIDAIWWRDCTWEGFRQQLRRFFGAILPFAQAHQL